MRIPLSLPDITKREKELVNSVLDSGILSIGPYINRFEEMICEYTGAENAVAVNSGTSGLHLIVKSMDIGEGDEVITTPFSFIASANCIMFEKAKPVFVDIDEGTFNIDINSIESKITPRTKAILPVDVFGQPVNMEFITEIADKYGLKVIEDSCEALGSEYKGIKAGTMCDAGIYAFYPNKQITTGEGGVITTNDNHLAELCRSYRSQGRPITGFWLHHERIGYNYRLSELHAALGVAQMERLEQIIEKRKNVADMYNERISVVKECAIPFIDPYVSRMSWFVYVIRINREIDRNTVMRYLQEKGVGCRPYFTPIHLQPYMMEMYGYKAGDFPVTEGVADSTVALPFFSNMTEQQVEYVVKVLRQAIKRGA